MQLTAMCVCCATSLTLSQQAQLQTVVYHIHSDCGPALGTAAVVCAVCYHAQYTRQLMYSNQRG